MDEPGFRASITQGMLTSLAEWYPDAARTVRERLGGATVERILETSRMAWIPLREHVPVADEIMRALGPEHHAYARRLFVRQAQVPLLKNMAETMLKLFGVDMRSGIKWLPRGWDSIARGCGTLTYAPGEGKIICTITLDGFPPEHFASRSIVEQCRGSYEGAFELFRRQGTVRIAKEDAARGYAVFEFVEA